MIEGTLIVNNKNLQVKFLNKKEKEVSMNVKELELSASLLEKKKSAIAQLHGLEVELEEVGGQPKQIREKGQQWQSPSVQSSSQKSNNNQQSSSKRPSRNAQSRSPQNQAIRQRTSVNIKQEFHNPYNFIPAPPRNTEHPELGDHLPKGHGCYHQNYWSGRISVTLKTITPLLIPDAANATEDNDNHKTYPIRIDAEGKPYLPPTSIKGMLRSAYESVTNSRLSIFEKHEDRLAYRSLAKAKPEIFPARVENKDGTLCLRIMAEPGLVGYTAKLPRYDKNSSNQDRGESRAALKYEGTNITPRHGDRVWVKLNAKGKVTHIRQENKSPQSLFDWKTGWVCITGANINEKMNERVFIDNPDNEFIPVTKEHKYLWKELINNYQNIHQKNLNQRQENNQSPKDYLGAKPEETAWSNHIWQLELTEFNEGTLCYVELDKNDEVLAIQPVTISRRLYELSPNKLLDSSLHPANAIQELSPADRVFGWVKQNKRKSINQKGTTAYKGNLRIFNVTCQTDDGIEFLGDDGFPIAILGEPKEQQARFYQAEDKTGNPLDNISKEEAYSDIEQGLRGRKVYPHHNGLPDNHWSDPNSYRKEAIEGHHQEYRQPLGDNEKTEQNRSIQAWVKPNVEFSFTIDIINLSSVELGALVWLLSLEDNHYHRLGGGKPLGFGSIKLSINWKDTDFRMGQDWQKYYQSLLPINAPDAKEAMDSIDSCVKLFKNAVEQAYGNGTTFRHLHKLTSNPDDIRVESALLEMSFEDVSFIKAFRTAAKGFDDNLPIHYPRTTKEPNPKGEGFDWFVANEKVGKGLQLALPLLAEDTGLPFSPTKS